MLERLITVEAASEADAFFRTEFDRRAGARFDVVPGTADHVPFLRTLFGETLAESVRRAGGDPGPLVAGPLFELQFEAQSRGYAAAYPHANDYIVLCRAEGSAIGRLCIDWAPALDLPITGVDIAVLPSTRAGAAGLHLLRAWVRTCDWLGRAARLHVLPDNPARRLYGRLGFLETDAAAFPIPMRREPTGSFRPTTGGRGKDPAAQSRC